MVRESRQAHQVDHRKGTVHSVPHKVNTGTHADSFWKDRNTESGRCYVHTLPI